MNLEGQLKAVHKAHEGSKLNLTQAIEACNFATKKRRAAERQLAKLQVCIISASACLWQDAVLLASCCALPCVLPVCDPPDRS